MADMLVYTLTMANIYENQGEFEKAYKIIKHLLKNEPDRKDLQVRLAEIENEIIEKERQGSEKLVNLFNQWFDLIFRYNNLNRIKKIRDMSQ